MFLEGINYSYTIAVHIHNDLAGHSLVKQQKAYISKIISFSELKLCTCYSIKQMFLLGLSIIKIFDGHPGISMSIG